MLKFINLSSKIDVLGLDHISTLNLNFQDKKYDMIQFWCHGSQGAIYLGTTSVAVDELIFALSKKIKHNGTIWFRSCYTLAGTYGNTFGKKLIAGLSSQDPIIIGHYGIIGLMQSNMDIFQPHTIIQPKVPTRWYHHIGFYNSRFKRWCFALRPKILLRSK